MNKGHLSLHVQTDLNKPYHAVYINISAKMTTLDHCHELAETLRDVLEEHEGHYQEEGASE